MTEIRNVRREQATVFLVSALVPYPPERGVELRIYRLLRWLRHEGYHVVLVLTAESLDAKVIGELRKVADAVYWTKPALRTRLGMRFPNARRVLWESLKRAASAAHPEAVPSSATSATSDARDGAKGVFAPERLISLVRRLARKYRPSAVIAEYIFAAPVFAGLPSNTLKILDTIDVFSRKEEEVLAYGIADSLSCSREEERQYLLQADVVVAIQSKEAELLRELVPERTVILVGIDFDVRAPLRRADEGRNSLALIASANALNVHGLSAFLLKCWPIIKARVPSITLHVVGRAGELCRIEDSSIRFSGWVANLDEVYREASVIINPTIAGTGLKVKSVQALAHGKPLVAWSNGVEGIRYTGDAPFVECNSWNEFSDAVVRLLQDDVARAKLAELALTYARREFATATTYAALGDCLARSSESTGASNRQKTRARGGATVAR